MARQIAVLGLVIAVVALSLAYPLRNYLTQRAALADAVAFQQAQEKTIAELEIARAAYDDPAYIRAQAKLRLQYVQPGDTVYVVQLPAAADDDAAVDDQAAAAGPWYATLWDTMTDDSGPAVDPTVLTPSAPPSADPTAGVSTAPSATG